MSIDKILKEQNEWLAKAPQSFKLERVKPADTALLRTATEKRIADVGARIESLTKARDTAVQRFDEAIGGEKAEIDRLQKALKDLPPIDR